METYFALSHHIDGFFFSVSFHFSVSSIPSIVKRSIRIFNAFVNETTGLLDVVLLSILNKTEKFNLGQKKTFVRNIKTRTYFFSYQFLCQHLWKNDISDKDMGFPLSHTQK